MANGIMETLRKKAPVIAPIRAVRGGERRGIYWEHYQVDDRLKNIEGIPELLDWLGVGYCRTRANGQRVFRSTGSESRIIGVEVRPKGTIGIDFSPLCEEPVGVHYGWAMGTPTQALENGLIKPFSDFTRDASGRGHIDYQLTDDIYLLRRAGLPQQPGFWIRIYTEP